MSRDPSWTVWVAVAIEAHADQLGRIDAATAAPDDEPGPVIGITTPTVMSAVAQGAAQARSSAAALCTSLVFMMVMAGSSLSLCFLA